MLNLKKEAFWQGGTTQEEQSYQLEDVLMSYIKDGELVKLKNTLQNIPTTTVSHSLKMDLRHSKNNCIVSVSIAARAAMQGGAPKETINQLLDRYINQMEEAKDKHTLYLILNQSFYEFTKYSKEAKFWQKNDPLISKVINYIYTNISNKITVSIMAKDLDYDRSYLSKRVKALIGISLSSLIRHFKISEAKSLLLYSDISLIEISEYLFFSSQNHFQTVFKKEVGCTPNNFRRMHEDTCAI